MAFFIYKEKNMDGKHRAKPAKPTWEKMFQPKQGSGLKHNYIEVPKKQKQSITRPQPWDAIDVIRGKKK